ncbi:hypothetical protein LTS18_005173 [Coniosporium uncinatum]|uniref:Uncharacterized protein n=1 Tax=Coniosporium uncinatum TaxID=93489 RepID=A0ACC3DRF6_9PEZI|nr:hypothetical protein LTS18_005173 [Coniosporium uncinatum]
MHEQYGPVVRGASDELSYTDSRAWKDIYGHHGAGEFPKDPMEYPLPVNGVANILAAERNTHGRYRRLLSHSFSEKGMREMQPHIQYYVNLLIERLKEHSRKGPESFDCLENARTDPWIQAVFGNVKSVPFIGSLCRYGLGRLIQWITPKRLLELRMQNYLRNVDKIERRIQKGTDRGDFWDNVLEKSDFEKGTGMTKQEMISYASILVLGGSETTATSLSETTHLPCTHPEVLKKLNAEVRSVFSDEDGIDLISVNKLDYMLAVLDESMRLYPPVPKQGCRKVPVKGAVICGRWVPGGTSVQAQQYASNHVESNFHRPSEFLPQRWLGAAEFASDDRAARQPFSMGPRNCIRTNLAYAEMRLTLAKVCSNFDLQLEERSQSWIEEQQIFGLWEKGPLSVRLTPVKR